MAGNSRKGSRIFFCWWYSQISSRIFLLDYELLPELRHTTHLVAAAAYIRLEVLIHVATVSNWMAISMFALVLTASPGPE